MLEQPPRAGKHRKSRLSMHTLLPAGLFSKQGPTSPPGARSPDAPRKLRKSRSNSDLPPRSESDASMPESAPATVSAASTDPFGDVVGFAAHGGASASASSSSLLAVPGPSAPAPFGPGVVFFSPASAAPAEDDTQQRVRVMASFESGRTARASGSSSGGSCESLVPLPPAHPPLDPARATSSLVFDVLQAYTGLPRPSRLSARSALQTVKLSSTATAAPKDDPRFVLYSADGERAMLAATLERWVAQLTSELDYDALLDFFLPLWVAAVHSQLRIKSLHRT